MAHVNRRIGKSSETAIDTADGTGGGVLDAFLHDYFQRSGNVVNVPGFAPDSGIQASGGVINDYTSGSDVYRAHIFTSSGTFNVTSLSNSQPNDIHYLVVAGGGGTGSSATSDRSGGGGAGGLRTNVPGHPLAGASLTATVQNYTVTVGGGGSRGIGTGPTVGGSNHNGSPSVFGPITSTGGGGGGAGHGTTAVVQNGAPGGSGGGAGYLGPGGGGSGSGSAGDGNTPPVSPAQGNNGGTGQGGGGGGAGGAGGNGPNGTSGASSPSSITGTAINYSRGGFGGDQSPAQNGTESRGHGGDAVFNGSGKSGGSGIVVVRYKIGSIESAKATGGNISFYGGKTIHAFTSSGTFTVTNGPISAEFFIVAGGGGGGYDAAGGGGAGGVVHHPGLTVADGPYAVTIGGGGAGSTTQPARGDSGVPSSIAFPTTYTATGGGGGGSRQQSPGGDGGSGGGGGRQSGTAGGSAQPASNPGATEYGNDGGPAGTHAGGGGGAGSAGQPFADGPNIPGWGGTGIQAPTTFRNPDARYGGSIPGGDPSGNDWGFAGGGGGGGFADPSGTYGGSWTPSGRIPGGPYYGGGSGALDPPAPTTEATVGLVNTGGGGGGGNNGPAALGASGGSGIVLIAYPT